MISVSPAAYLSSVYTGAAVAINSSRRRRARSAWIEAGGVSLNISPAERWFFRGVLAVALISLLVLAAAMLTGCASAPQLATTADSRLQPSRGGGTALQLHPGASLVPVMVTVTVRLSDKDLERFRCAAYAWDWGEGARPSGHASSSCDVTAVMQEGHVYRYPGRYCPRLILVDADAGTLAIPCAAPFNFASEEE